jgi:hypothetical protein
VTRNVSNLWHHSSLVVELCQNTTVFCWFQIFLYSRKVECILTETRVADVSVTANDWGKLKEVAHKDYTRRGHTSHDKNQRRQGH